LAAKQITPEELTHHLGRLARFGANITDAHTCAIFVPESIIGGKLVKKRLSLMGFHSLTDEITEHASIEAGAGLIGWVAQHAQAIHVSPFDRDSRTLGYYRANRELKSFMAAPVPISIESSSGSTLTHYGVVACDSKKSYAFSKLQGRLLEDLASEINAVLALCVESKDEQTELSWDTFRSGAHALIQALGGNSIEVLRMAPSNYLELEQKVGMSAAVEMAEQLFRLFQQALPPHFPITHLPNGDIVVMLDKMMVPFYQNKLNALCSHVSREGSSLLYTFSRTPLETKKGSTNSTSLKEAVAYEYRRA